MSLAAGVPVWSGALLRSQVRRTEACTDRRLVDPVLAQPSRRLAVAQRDVEEQACVGPGGAPPGVRLGRWRVGREARGDLLRIAAARTHQVAHRRLLEQG